MTLTDFLLARIAEDEALIEGDWSSGDGGLHIITAAAYDRLRAECEAKRRIVTELIKQREHNRSLAVDLATTDSVIGLAAAVTGGLDFACHVAATVYADHLDYREEWKP